MRNDKLFLVVELMKISATGFAFFTFVWWSFKCQFNILANNFDIFVTYSQNTAVAIDGNIPRRRFEQFAKACMTSYMKIIDELIHLLSSDTISKALRRWPIWCNFITVRQPDFFTANLKLWIALSSISNSCSNATILLFDLKIIKIWVQKLCQWENKFWESLHTRLTQKSWSRCSKQLNGWTNDVQIYWLGPPNFVRKFHF